MIAKVNAAGLFTNEKQTIQTSDMVIDLLYVDIKIEESHETLINVDNNNTPQCYFKIRVKSIEELPRLF